MLQLSEALAPASPVNCVSVIATGDSLKTSAEPPIAVVISPVVQASIVMLAGGVTTGGVVSPMLMDCEADAVFPQPSVTVNVRVTTTGQVPVESSW